MKTLRTFDLKNVLHRRLPRVVDHILWHIYGTAPVAGDGHDRVVRIRRTQEDPACRLIEPVVSIAPLPWCCLVHELWLPELHTVEQQKSLTAVVAALLRAVCEINSTAEHARYPSSIASLQYRFGCY